MKRIYKFAIGGVLIAYTAAIVYSNLNTYTPKIKEDVNTMVNELVQEDPYLIQANKHHIEQKSKKPQTKVKVKGIEEIILE